MNLFAAANQRVNENANAALGAQNRGGISGANMIALQASEGNEVKADETSNTANTRDKGEAEELAARLAEANSRLDAQSDAAEVEDADDTSVSTRMAEITSTIMEQAEVAADTDTQKVELNETLMNALNDVREQKETSEEKKEDDSGGIASLAA
jgi:hypothetical protein